MYICLEYQITLRLWSQMMNHVTNYNVNKTMFNISYFQYVWIPVVMPPFPPTIEPTIMSKQYPVKVANQGEVLWKWVIILATSCQFHGSMPGKNKNNKSKMLMELMMAAGKHLALKMKMNLSTLPPPLLHRRRIITILMATIMRRWQQRRWIPPPIGLIYSNVKRPFCANRCIITKIQNLLPRRPPPPLVTGEDVLLRHLPPNCVPKINGMAVFTVTV